MNTLKKEYNCEICGEKHHFDDMSTCDRCGRFVCGNCSEAVVNREVNPFGYDFLCNECKEELLYAKIGKILIDSFHDCIKTGGNNNERRKTNL